MTRFTSFGKDVHDRIRTFFDTPLDADATPLEIAHGVLDDIERHVQPVRRGRRLFPFGTVTIRVRTSGSSATAVTAAFEDFGARVGERLAELRCDAPRALDVQVECLADVPAEWPSTRVFEVTYLPDAPVSPDPLPSEAASAAPPILHIIVLRGTAAEAEGRFTEATVSIGRSTDPTDALGRMRRNRVAFLDIVDGVNETVGRAHARLRSDVSTREVRLFDEGSRNGTAILRGGEVIPVHRRDPRGVRVRSGDEIQLGRAVLRIDIGK